MFKALANTIPVILPARQIRVSRLIWYCITLIGIVDSIWLWHTGMGIDAQKPLPSLFALVSCLVVSVFYRNVRKDDTIALFCQIAAQIIAGSAALAVLSYLGAGLAFPLYDENYVAADHFLHFNWRNWVLGLDGWPIAVGLLTIVYRSFEVQMLLMLSLLFYYRHTDHIQRFLVAFFYSGFVVVVVSTLFPATGGYDYYHLGSNQLQHVDAESGAQHLRDLLAMRNHSMIILPANLKGLVTFPSFHAAVAVLLIYASLPLPWLAILAVPVNLLMLVSTLANGGHYLVDIISGLLIAWNAIAVSRWIVPEKTTSPA